MQLRNVIYHDVVGETETAKTAEKYGILDNSKTNNWIHSRHYRRCDIFYNICISRKKHQIDWSTANTTIEFFFNVYKTKDIVCSKGQFLLSALGVHLKNKSKIFRSPDIKVNTTLYSLQIHQFFYDTNIMDFIIFSLHLHRPVLIENRRCD